MDDCAVSQLRSIAIGQLKDVGVHLQYVQHAVLVADISTDIARKIIHNGHSLEISDVVLGALFHDVGYVNQKGIRHAIAGGQIVRDLGYGEKVARIVESHILGGLSKELILSSKLDLPHRDFLPITIEEKLVAVADQLVHSRSKKHIFLKEDPSKNTEIALNIFSLYEEILQLAFACMPK
ncbi:MAG: HD domain-containing protein [Planctomycetes bacterium]|nr:HD domain-containing protein [Planctomycetota bacterium]